MNFLKKLICPAFFVAAMLTAAFVEPPPKLIVLKFLSGPKGSAWGSLGFALESAWLRGLRNGTVKPQPGDPINNVHAIEAGRVNIALGTSTVTADAVEGRAPFLKKYANVCQAAALFPNALQIVATAESKIASLTDLKGRVVAFPPKGDAAEPVAHMVLKAVGMKVEDFKATFADGLDSVKLMEEGKVEALILGGPVPLPALTAMAYKRDVTLVSIPEDTVAALERENAGFFGASLRPETYPNQRDYAVTGAYAVQLLIPCNTSEPRGFALTRVVAKNIDALSITDRSFQGMSIETMAEPFGAPIHEGSRRLFETGLAGPEVAIE